MKQWQAIIFDLDDTLYPERDYVLSGFRAVAEWLENQIGVSAAEAFHEMKVLYNQGVRGRTFNQWLAQRGLPEDLVPQMVSVYRQHWPDIRPFPEVPNLLLELRPDYRLGLLSDGYLEAQRRKLDALGIAHFFDAVLFSDELGRAYWKPHVRPFEVILQRLHVKGAQAVYIGDNPLKDFYGAKQTGITTIWLRRPNAEYTALTPPSPAYAPDVQVQTLQEAIFFIREGRF